MIKIYKNDVLHYDDVVIVPQHSTIRSRKEIDCSAKLGGLTLSVPVLSANMDTVTGKEMCLEMFKLGGLGVMHRFMSIDENVTDYQFVTSGGADCFISVGVTRDSKERLEALYEAGARYVCIDIAHGDHILMHDMIKWIREKYQDTVYIMAGNVGTASGAKNLEHWGANAVKVGLSNGSVCITKNVTGVSTPMITTIAECAAAVNIPVVGDGGLRTSGDIAKALGAGADVVMCGGMFAGCDETPPVVKVKHNDGDSILETHKVPYRGNASAETMKKFRPSDDMPTPEGKQIYVDRKGPACIQMNYIRDGVKSSMSYSNSRTLEEFRSKVMFSVKKH